MSPRIPGFTAPSKVTAEDISILRDQPPPYRLELSRTSIDDKMVSALKKLKGLTEFNNETLRWLRLLNKSL
jgi:hypothetical protein